MNNKRFRGEYLIKSVRLPGWDYSWPGYYFITICTLHRKKHFGQIINSQVILSKIGEIVDNFWCTIPEHFDNVSLDEYIIMPDHIHGIIIIDNKRVIKNSDVETPESGASTINPAQNNHLRDKKNTSKPGTLGVIICQFKGICTMKIREFCPEFAWQPRFHDRIIRTSDEYERIKEYIIKNPSKHHDTLYTK